VLVLVRFRRQTNKQTSLKVDPAKITFSFYKMRMAQGSEDNVSGLVTVQGARGIAEESIIWEKMQHKVT